MIKKYQILKIVSFIIISILTGCQPISKTQIKEFTKSPDQITSLDEGYPITSSDAQYQSSNSNYPAPDTTPYVLTYPDHLDTPQPSKNTGVVLGRLITDNGITSPYLAPAIYLGRAIPADKPEFPPLISLDIEIDPLAVQDKNGNFIFTSVQPGQYGLLLWSPYSQTLIVDPDNEGFPLLIEVQQGSIVELGTIIVP